MKLIVLTLVFLLWSVARADETVVAEVRAGFWRTEATPMFEINRDQGRAWVTIKAWDASQARRDRYYSYYRQLVPGLTFDKESSTIVYEKDGAITTCAKVESRGRSIFRWDYIQPTNCELKLKKVMRDYDDGFEIRRIEMMQVLLNVL
ncbi:hypothetical protein [Peredibacter starrii]|uniref:Lipocalin-like domain-containing protein n=1 Tax=Peredibacter starrii TaxID=28202 RepID=A0AAX4HUN4_9BACT|nr:hypothetical protein [Peredibacter starrii]WPU67108.1 hypothetical protein SOO65_10115 [Peredibacter starrii]